MYYLECSLPIVGVLGVCKQSTWHHMLGAFRIATKVDHHAESPSHIS